MDSQVPQPSESAIYFLMNDHDELISIIKNRINIFIIIIIITMNFLKAGLRVKFNLTNPCMIPHLIRLNQALV